MSENLDPKDYKNGELINKSLKPEAKVAAAGIAGAITVVLVWSANLIWPDLEIPNEVIAAVTAIIAFSAGYIKKN